MDKKMLAKSNRWHGYADTEIYIRRGRVTETKETKYFIIQEREVSYRFYLHQHPYVRQLTQRLIRKGTAGLQAVDTEYNTRIRLTNATTVKGSGGESVPLAAGEILYLSDGATATLDGAVIRFAGSRVLKLLDNSQVTTTANKAVRIAGKTVVRRSAGGSVTLGADTAATLVDGMPLPELYSEIFTPTRYNPSNLVQRSYPVKDLDFTSSGAYSVYNWELFFH